MMLVDAHRAALRDSPVLPVRIFPVGSRDPIRGERPSSADATTTPVVVSGQGESVGGGGCTAPLSRSLRLVPDGFRPPPRSDRSRCPKPSATVATQSQRTPAARRAGAVEAGDRADHVMRHVTLPRCDRSPRPQSTCHASPGLRLRSSHVTMPPSITAGMPGREAAGFAERGST